MLEAAPAPALIRRGFPDAGEVLSRAGGPPEEARADPARPETDPEMCCVHGLLPALRGRSSGKL